MGLESLAQGLPNRLPEHPGIDASVDHAPRRKDILTQSEKRLALRNALRYFKPDDHAILAPEFKDELINFGRIYMHRFRPTEYEMRAHPIDAYPAKSKQASAIMLMIQNNLDPAVAQFPHELITYGGNGAVFQNWAQYHITMGYLSQMNENQTLVKSFEVCDLPVRAAKFVPRKNWVITGSDDMQVSIIY